jgi:predicted outer membrane lipoprotein
MVLDRLLLDNFITTSTVMARTERLVAAGLFNVNRPISHDFELWLRMAAQWPIAYLDQPLVRYRCVQGSVSANKLAAARDALAVIEAFWQEHSEHRARHGALYRRSVAEHLAVAGSAALAQGSRRSGLGYLLRALRLDPRKRRAWKSLVKAMIQPVRVPTDRRAPLARAGTV